MEYIENNGLSTNEAENLFSFQYKRNIYTYNNAGLYVQLLKGTKMKNREKFG